jgi:N-acetylglutamate synthase-like GNAT family acetyltransferase
MNPVIRPATIDDMDSLVSLMNYLLSIDGDFPNSEENQRRGFEMVINSDKAWVFVIESAGKIEGMCSMFSFISTVQGGYVGMIEDVVVKEEVAGQGLGQQLLEYADFSLWWTKITRLPDRFTKRWTGRRLPSSVTESIYKKRLPHILLSSSLSIFLFYLLISTFRLSLQEEAVQ